MQTQSVSQVVGHIKNLLEDEFIDLTVQGEITNLSKSSAGHFYFNISDRNSALSCALFKMDALRNPIIRRIKDGDKVILRGPISVYQKRGSFQLIVKRITPFGKGDLKAEFEKLKVSLAKKGFFDIAHKQKIPSLPRRIGIITALGAAALQDFLNVMKRRALWHDIVIIPATVQGDNCAPSVIKAIEKAVAMDDLDVLVITRGGGSLEDLWGFNDQRLVERVYNCPIPVVSAIGHQVDYTLLDYVSDMRCETPSTAAETLSQEHTLIQRKLSHITKLLRMHIVELNAELEKKIYKLNPANAIKNLHKMILENQHKLESLNLAVQSDLLRINEYHQYLDDLFSRTTGAISNRLSKVKTELNYSGQLLNSLNPENVLLRGYSILSTTDGKVLTSHKDFATIKSNESLSIKFSDGIGKVKK